MNNDLNFDDFDNENPFGDDDSISNEDNHESGNIDVPTDSLHIGMIKLLGVDVDSCYNYEFIFTDKPNEFWGENFEYMPCSFINNLTPNVEYLTKIIKVKCLLKFDLIQNCSCFSMQDAMDGIISIAWENIDGYDVYPENGRLYFRFGESYDEVERKLAVKHIILDMSDFIKN